jgi:predicted RecB family nuclease
MAPHFVHHVVWGGTLAEPNSQRCNMSGKITNDVLEGHLKCRYKGYLKTMREQGPPHPYEILMKESRERIRQAATARLLARHNGGEVSSGVPLTQDLLKGGLPLLLDAAFEDEDLSVRFDALLRVDGDSPLGGFHYQPVIFHEAEKATADLRMLLALLGVILCRIQGKEPATGVMIYGCGCQERKACPCGKAA